MFVNSCLISSVVVNGSIPTILTSPLATGLLTLTLSPRTSDSFVCRTLASFVPSCPGISIISPALKALLILVSCIQVLVKLSLLPFLKFIWSAISWSYGYNCRLASYVTTTFNNLSFLSIAATAVRGVHPCRAPPKALHRGRKLLTLHYTWLDRFIFIPWW